MATVTAAYAQTRRATSPIRRSFASCSSRVMTFEISPEAKPHCGLTASRSSGTYRVASSIARDEDVGVLERAVFRRHEPEHNLMVRAGRLRAERSVPARSESYSSRSRSMFSRRGKPSFEIAS